MINLVAELVDLLLVEESPQQQDQLCKKLVAAMQNSGYTSFNQFIDSCSNRMSRERLIAVLNSLPTSNHQQLDELIMELGLAMDWEHYQDLGRFIADKLNVAVRPQI